MQHYTRSKTFNLIEQMHANKSELKKHCFHSVYVLIEFNYFADWNLHGLLRPVFIVLQLDHRLVSSGKPNLIILRTKQLWHNIGSYITYLRYDQVALTTSLQLREAF